MVTVALGIALCAGGGCTGTDFLTVDTGDLLLEVEVRNFGQTRYEGGSVVVADIQVRPTSPAASAALGEEPIGLLSVLKVVNLTAGVDTLPTPVLHSGSYSVEAIRLLAVDLLDEDPPVDSPVCIEGVVNPGDDDVLDTGDDFASLPDRRFTNFSVGKPFLTLTDLGSATFSVPPQGEGRVRLVIDAAALIAAFEGAFLCAPAPDFGPFADTCAVGVLRFPSHSCLNGFDEADFEDASPTFISFE